MALIGIGRLAVAVLTSLTFAVSRPLEAIHRFVFAIPMPDTFVRIGFLFRELFGSPQLSPLGPSTPASSALLNHNRHEAGLAKLGAVRHI